MKHIHAEYPKPCATCQFAAMALATVTDPERLARAMDALVSHLWAEHGMSEADARRAVEGMVAL